MDIDKEIFQSFAQELEKLARRSTPVVRSKAKKNEKVEAAKPGKFQRGVGALIGSGMAVTQAPLLQGYAAGRRDVYHATTFESAADILSEASGIDPSHAGKGTKANIMDLAQSFGSESTSAVPKKARINRYLMGESLNRMLESKGLPISPADSAKNIDLFHDLMDRGMKSGKAAEKVFQEVSQKLVRSGHLKPADLPGLSKALQEELPQFGQRVYAGTHPADVRAWASGKSEGQLVAERMKNTQSLQSSRGQLKSQLHGVVDALSGGWKTNVENVGKRLNYKPKTTESMTLAEAAAELRRLKAQNPKAGVIFGASAPTGKMGYMTDFPVIKHLVNLNPGLKTSLKNFIDTYEPGRDLSFPDAIPSSNIHTVDVVDHATDTIRRIKIKDAVKAGRGALGARMKKIVAPAALAALGGHMMYRAIKPKTRMVPKGSPLDPAEQDRQIKEQKMLFNRWSGKKSGKEKQSSVASDVGRVAKYVIPTVAVGGAIGALNYKLMDKILPENKKNKGIAGQGKEIGKAMGRQFGAAILNLGAGGALGAGAGLALRSRIKAPLTKGQAAAIGAGIGAFATSQVANFGSMGMEIGKTPELDPILGALPERVQDYIRERPEVGAAFYTATAAALPIGGAYMMRKYYPGTYGKMTEGLKKAVKEFI